MVRREGGELLRAPRVIRMIKSMTAFGRGRNETEERIVTVEIKSVNSRFFDCTVKMPRAYAFLEERVRSYIQKNAVSRAKVDVYVTVENRSTPSLTVEIDRAYAKSYIDALRTLAAEFGLRDDISAMSVARNPDILLSVREEADMEREWEFILPALETAARDYLHTREVEGEKIYRDLCEKLESVRTLSGEVAEISRTDTVGYRARLEERIRKILGECDVVPDEARLLTECAVFADKIAIDEELVRLGAHFGAFYEIAGAAEPSGRKLDFLMQELNRETNTIGSKANNARIARIVVDMKGELEKMREQIQNVE
ncbi:MAG: YicC family protein [Clostridia bacterium]|nr:YicC family protein [Clostridia bacterium]